MKKIYVSLTEKQATFLHDNPDFDVDGWFLHALDNEINERKCKNENYNHSYTNKHTFLNYRLRKVGKLSLGERAVLNIKK